MLNDQRDQSACDPKEKLSWTFKDLLELKEVNLNRTLSFTRGGNQNRTQRDLLYSTQKIEKIQYDQWRACTEACIQQLEPRNFHKYLMNFKRIYDLYIIPDKN